MVRLNNPFRFHRSESKKKCSLEPKNITQKQSYVSLPTFDRMNQRELQDDIIEFLVSRSARSKIFRSLLDYSDCYRDIPVRKIPKASFYVVSNLPFTPIYSHLRDMHGEAINAKCLICLDRLIDGIAIQRLPCGHVYHMNCIVPWLQSSCYCPECRYELPTSDFMFEIGRRQRMMNRKVVRCACSKNGHTCFFGTNDVASNSTNLNLCSSQFRENQEMKVCKGARAA